MVVSQNRGTPIQTQKYYSPYYWDPQTGTPNFGKPPYTAFRHVLYCSKLELKSRDLVYFQLCIQGNQDLTPVWYVLFTDPPMDPEDLFFHRAFSPKPEDLGLRFRVKGFQGFGGDGCPAGRIRSRCASLAARPLSSWQDRTRCHRSQV